MVEAYKTTPKERGCLLANVRMVVGRKVATLQEMAFLAKLRRNWKAPLEG